MDRAKHLLFGKRGERCLHDNFSHCLLQSVMGVSNILGIVVAAISVTIVLFIVAMVRRISGGSGIGSMRGRDCGNGGDGC